MVFIPALVGARNSARDSRTLRPEGAETGVFRMRPSFSLSMWTARRRRTRPVALPVEDPLQALMSVTDMESAVALAEVPVAAAPAAHPAVYVKNFTFAVSRFNQPERQHIEVLLDLGTISYAPAETALQAVAEPVAAQELPAEDAAIPYGAPEPLYVRRAVYGQRELRNPSAFEDNTRAEMTPYPYAPPYPYPAQANPYAAAYPMVAPPPQGYAPPPQAMAPQFPNPYAYPYAFAPAFPYPGFPPYAMGYPPYMGYPMPAPPYPAQPQLGPMGPQLVEPYAAAPPARFESGYPQNPGRWEHRSAVPYRSLYRRA